MVQPLKIGVIGLGVGEQHVIGYQAIDGCEVVAVCDQDPGKLAEVADRQDIPERHTDPRHVTEHPDIDAVSICSWDDAHADQAVSAFRHGKHVMVEKPVALRREDAARILEAQQTSGRLISSNLILRHSPRFRAVRDMVRNGDFGDIFYMEGDYLHQILWKITEGWRGSMDFYCVTFGGGIHLIDLMRWILNDEVTEVAGMGNKMLTRDGQYKYPDTIASLLRFEKGTLAKSVTTFGPRRRQIHTLNVYGTELAFENGLPDARLFRGEDPGDEEPMTVPYPAINKFDLLPDFVGAIRESREPNVSARDVFRVMDICFAAWQAVETGRTVKVDYLL